MNCSEAAVITRASSGIGEAAARALLDYGLTLENGFITGRALFVCGGTSITGTGGA